MRLVAEISVQREIKKEPKTLDTFPAARQALASILDRLDLL
jgi:hypothetical protein